MVIVDYSTRSISAAEGNEAQKQRSKGANDRQMDQE